jgi:hypothetical protein
MAISSASSPCAASFASRLNLTKALLLEQDCARVKKQKGKKKRGPSLFEQRLQWDSFVSKHAGRPDLHRHLRMTLQDFNLVLSVIKKRLEVNVRMAKKRGGPILPELCLYATLRYLAGGSYSDIKYFTGISRGSLYRVIWKCMKAIIKCKELDIKFPQTVEEVKRAARGFESISTQGCIWNCVSVADGYHLQTQTPSKKEVKNVRSFFSGHYQCYGVNVQAACDHHCRFTFLGVAAPGVTGDRDAIDLVALGSLVKNLPGLYCVIADCAYTATEKLVLIFRGDMARIPRNDVFNFYASQLRIRIEMAFGLMVQKWGILSRPLRIKIRKVKKLIIAVARLHNYCINRRLLAERRKLKKKGDGVVQYSRQGMQLSLLMKQCYERTQLISNGMKCMRAVRKDGLGIGIEW